MNNINVKELGHIVLYVRDINVSANFYENILGWKRVDAKSDFPIAMFSNGRTHHELLLIEVGMDAKPIPLGRRIGLYHFGLKIGDSDEDLKQALLVLQENNVEIIGTADHTFTHSLYIADPDGNEIELYIDMPGVDWNDPKILMQAPRHLDL
jgi:catechol 2,3-dioxygenase